MTEIDRAVAKVNQLTATARGGWLSLLTFLAFIGVTLIGVQDADFFIPTRETDLPLIGVSIPTERFFIFAPVLAAALYANLHFHLLKLWEALTPEKAPAFKNSRHFSDRINGSFIAEMALALRRDTALRLRPLRWTTVWLTFMLIFAAGPIVLGFFWWRSMPKHDELLTVVFCGVPFLFSLNICIYSFSHLWQSARGDGARGRPQAGRRVATWSITIGVSLLGWLTTEGTLDHYKRTWTGLAGSLVNLIPIDGTETFLVRADLAGVDFIGLPDDWLDYDEARARFEDQWCRDQGIPLAICGDTNLDAAESERRDNRRLAWCKRQFDAVDQASCDAEFASHSGQLDTAWATHRRLEVASLPDRFLRGLDLRYANFLQARLEGANLSFARLEGANLSGARLEGATLMKARLEGTDLRRAPLKGANLRGARLEGADLRRARLEGANLVEARLDASTSFSPATLRGAGLKEVDLTTFNLDPAVFRKAFGDSTVKLPEGVELHPGAPVDRELEWSEWEDQWRAWQKRNGYASK